MDIREALSGPHPRGEANAAAPVSPSPAGRGWRSRVRALPTPCLQGLLLASLALGLAVPVRAQSTPFEERHAKDQVAWRFWSTAAVAEAQASGRPLLLSIGFEGCPGCEQMSAESFSDPEIAKVMNDRFACLLLDAEAWPDTALQYAALAQELGVKPVYPLNLFLTPDLQPFAATGYLPPSAGPDEPPGWLDTLELLLADYDPDQAAATARQLASKLAARLDTAAVPAALPDSLRDAAVEALKEGFDAEYGGFGWQNKRVPCLELAFLLREAVARNDSVLRRMVTQTVDRIAASPTFDQLAGGIFTGCADRAWQVPNYEKRLADNALFARLLVELNLVTGDPKYRTLAELTLGYIADGLRRGDGALVEGQRGGREVWGWSAEQARAVIGPAADQLNWPDEPAIPGPFVLDAELRLKLLESRAEARQKACLPETRLASHGLAITAFARAAQAWGNPSDAENAVRIGLASRWIWPTDGPPADLADYALLAAASIDLWETAFAPKWLHEAMDLVAEAEAKLGGEPGQAFYVRAASPTGPPVRERRAVDVELPAGNAVMAEVLLRLGRLKEDHALRARAETVLQSFAQPATAEPMHHLSLLQAARYLNEDLPGIAILGPAEHAAPLLAAARSLYLPERVFAWLDPTADDADEVQQAVALFANRSAGDTARAYICTLHSCLRPVSAPDKLVEMLKAQTRPRTKLGL